jgi:hypothetical protein
MHFPHCMMIDAGVGTVRLFLMDSRLAAHQIRMTVRKFNVFLKEML